MRHCTSSMCGVFSMRFKNMCSLLHLLIGPFPVPYVPGRVMDVALVAQRYSYVPPRCKTSQGLRTFIPLSVSAWNDLADPVFDGVGLGLVGFKSRANAFIPFSLLSLYRLVLWGWDHRTDRV